MEAPAASARRFDVEGGLLLLDTSANTLFAYNDVARRIWELIEDGRPEPEIVAAVMRQWTIPRSLAQDDVRAIVALWRGQGLLAGHGERPQARAPAASPVVAVSGAPPSEWISTIRGVVIAFRVAAELPATVRALFGHLETPGAVAQSRMTIAMTPAGEFALIEDETERLRTADPALAIGALFVAVLERVRPGNEWFALLHGAAIARNGHGVGLIGTSGSGKSTLAAGLMAAGFDYLADDLVALSMPARAIVPWPLPLSLKPGAMEALTSRYPDLDRATRYRTKGVEARLLLPPATVWDAEPVRLTTLVFPRFIAGAAPETRRLTPFEALERLLGDRAWLGDPIDEHRVRAFLAWLDATPAYALSYGTLDDAVRLAGSVVP